VIVFLVWLLSLPLISAFCFLFSAFSLMLRGGRQADWVAPCLERQFPKGTEGYRVERRREHD
jgi:hypothetical protein